MPHISAFQCRLSVPVSVAYQCQSVLPNSASATYQCQSVPHISAIYQFHVSVLPFSAHQ
ncbi:unnamed protein product [Staurois parvus]|uniref:Uncharacterized protein n=1 Tax=Staurois parvus TaxID=386267 RepID=A0ABN9AWP0_9NEOB|nr:unnamed protein product [Staurois parvus]